MWKIILPILVLLGFLVVRKMLKSLARDYKYQLEYTKYFDELIQNGYKKSDALVEVSQTCHPELSLETHRKIATKFDDINILLRFLSCARTVGTEKDRLVEKKVLALLEVTTFEKGLIRTVRHTDSKRYFRIIDGL